MKTPALVAALRRWLWAGLVIASLAVILASGIYALAQRHHGYVATRMIVVSVLPEDSGGQLATLDAQQAADQATRALVAGQPFASPPFTGTVLASLRDPTQSLDTTYGAGTVASLASLNANAITTALSAARSGDHVALMAHWSTSGSARVLVDAALQALSAHPDLLFSGTSALPTGATGRVFSTESASTPERDPAQLSAARTRLASSLGLGLAAALVFWLLLAAWDLGSTGDWSTAKAATSIPANREAAATN